MKTHGRFVVVAAILIGALSSACGSTPGTTDPSTATARPPASMRPLPTTSDGDASNGAVGQASYTPKQFWFMMGGGVDMIATYNSHGSAVKAADLVIVGTLQRFEKGPVLKLTDQGDVAYTYHLTVKVGSVIKGAVISPLDGPGTVVVGAIHGSSWDEARFQALAASGTVGDRIVLFLYNPVADAARKGAPTGDIGRGAEIYVMLNGSDAWIRDNHGVAEVYDGEGSSAWMTAMGGQPFDDVVQTITAAGR